MSRIENRDPLTIARGRWVTYLRQPVRFLIAGLFNTGFSYTVYVLFLYVGFSFWLANLISLIAGICVGFFSQGSLVFANLGVRTFARFLIAWLTIYLVQTSVIGLLIRFGYSPARSGLMVLPGTVVVSYFVQKYFVFRVSDRNS